MANILVGGRLRLSCGRSRKVYVLLAANTLPSRSSGFPYVSQLSDVSAGFLRKKLNMFNFSASTRGTCGRSRKRAVYLAVYLRFLRFSAVVEPQRTAA